MQHNARELIERAIAIAGSQQKLGELVGKSQNTIWAARRAGRVSAELAAAIDEATNGEVPRWQLRPDLWEQPNTNPAEQPSSPSAATPAPE